MSNLFEPSEVDSYSVDNEGQKFTQYALRSHN